jgi:hypothetical protein
MNKLLTLAAALLGSVMLPASTPPLPGFQDKTIGHPPLSMKESIERGTSSMALEFGTRVPRHGNSGDLLPKPGPAPQPGAAPSRPDARRSGSRMPIIEPRDDVAYRMVVRPPNPAIDFKMVVIDPAPDAEATSQK